MIIDLLDRPIAYHRCFVTLTGSVTAAVLLSQAVYWSRRIGAGNDGWFWKTVDEWEEETGLSRYEQETARKILGRITPLFWEEAKRGIPRRLWYRLDLEQLERCLQNLRTSTRENPVLDRDKTPNRAGEKPRAISENTPETTTTLPPGGGVEDPFPSRAAIRERLSRDQSVILGALREILPTFRRSSKLEDLAEIAQELGATGNQIREFPAWAATRYPGRAVNLFFVTDYLTQFIQENTHGQKPAATENHDRSPRAASAPRETQQQRAAREFAEDQARLQDRIRAAEERERLENISTADQTGQQSPRLHA